MIDPTGRAAVVEPWRDLVFSMDRGFVWASWPGSSRSVRLGEYGPVRAMMQDFLDQSALGDRLAYRDAKH